MPAPKWRTWAFLLDSRSGSHGQPVPAPSPPVGELQPQEEPRGLDTSAQLVAAHRHTDSLPLGSKPGKTERRRDVPCFHPTGPTGGTPATRSAAKLRPSSLGPPASARRTLFRPREAA